ncbi:MAG: hypothetical protein IJY10_03300 [Lachnospiraceae bacterium]|nr:hypothetical protein [Lachnospiraceae bacterium]
MNKQQLLKKGRQIAVKALKIGIGSCIAILMAEFFELQNSVSAGTIALLTILSTRWDTFRLAYTRIISFFVTVLVCFLAFHLGSGWVQYGIAVIVIVIFCDVVGWSNNLSVNAVIGAHFFTSNDFSAGFIWNEFCLLLIGISIAIVLSLFTDNKGSKRAIVHHMHYVEKQMKVILGELAAYLNNQVMDHSVWDDVANLEEEIKGFIEEACKYRDNAVGGKRPEHYSDYFEMRLQQIAILRSLHQEMKRIRSMTAQGKRAAEYLLFMRDRVDDVHSLDDQYQKLHGMLEDMKAEALPETREEFESRAILYHVLLDLEDYILIKKRFVSELSEEEHKEIFLRG